MCRFHAHASPACFTKAKAKVYNISSSSSSLSLSEVMSISSPLISADFGQDRFQIVTTVS